MAKINQDLIERLQAKLGVGQNAVYTRIQRIMSDTALERHLAALVLGMRSDVNINKYSTPAERAEIRGALAAVASSSSTARPTWKARSSSGPIGADQRGRLRR